MQMNLPSSAAVVIVGGGIMGASIAWQLAMRSSGKIVLLERSTLASGASGRTGALLRQHYSNRPEATLAARSLEIFANWQDRVGGDCGFDRCGVIVTVPTADPFQENVDRLCRNAAMLRSIGTAIDVKTADELSAIEPAAVFDDVTAATFEPDSGYVDSGAATRSMAEAAVRAGVSVYEGVNVSKLVEQGGRISGVETSHGVILAPRVIIANGASSKKLAATIGLDLPVEALRVQVATFQRPRAMSAPHRVFVDNAAGLFCRPAGPGRSLVGVGGGDQHDPVDPDDFDPRNDLGYPDMAKAVMSKRFPAFAGASYLNGHACLYDMTPDGHPILGKAGPEGLYLAVGFSGAGFKKGPAIGIAMADLILDGGSDWIDLMPFRLDRFESNDWHAPWSPDEYELASDFGHGI
jgi:sarcosine oxidase subunit beta